MRWDLFCRVIDNFGDIGVCWRLARQLGVRGEAVRLFVDDASALAWMAPHGAAGVTVLPWLDAEAAVAPAEVVIEAFGCALPAAFVQRMARMSRPPVWINLEYLSAEPYVERSHGLLSPQHSGPGRGLRKWFFYPGFSRGSGGLLREDSLRDAQATFDAGRWLNGLVTDADTALQRISLFCYADAPLPALLRALPGQSALLLATQGAARQLCAALTHWPAQVRWQTLPWLSQENFDRLLGSCTLNLVRGEDSLVRAIWAGVPFVWQIYAQHDGAHGAKLQAFLDLYLHGAEPALAHGVRTLWLAWNRLGRWPGVWPEPSAWLAHARDWRAAQAAQMDLCTRLQAFAGERR